ncbi:unnamed protein product [Peronospora farinosa]|uniref:Uncharacterized protein n=3 Tax=Peronospora farinosa TaxID=134698 RepID=A0ABN8C9H9_9STRA|nr:unnamed protein product [Peronospora farinosa]
MTRAASFLSLGVMRNLLNRAALCLFFFPGLISNFIMAGYCKPENLTTIETHLDHFYRGQWTFLRDGLGTFDFGLNVYLSHRVTDYDVDWMNGWKKKLTRALRFTVLVMSACSVLFLLRTLIYIQRPFSHQGCGDIHNADVCVLLGYAIPEIVPCALFLVLMWEVEPTLEIPSRRSLSFNNGRVTSETTPLLEQDVMPRPLLIATKNRVNQVGGATTTQGGILPTSPVGGYFMIGRRPSSLSLGLGNGVLDRARRQLELVVRQHLGGGNKEQQPGDKNEFASNAFGSPGEYERQTKQLIIYDDDSRRLVSPPTCAWLSFQCFNLTLPSKSSVRASSFVVLHLMDAETGAMVAEIGRTEISHSEDPCFHIMLAVEMRQQDLLRASVYSVRNPNSLKDLNNQWLVGNPLVPVSLFMTDAVPAIGCASIFPLYSPLSRTRSSGELVVRCEAEVKGLHTGMSDGGLERITRSFMYIGVEGTDTEHASPRDDSAYSEVAQEMYNLASTSRRGQGKMLVEEELIESVYTWEVPYQLLQLILSDLLLKLDLLKREIALEDGDDSCSSTPSSQLSTPGVGNYALPIVISSSPRALSVVQETETEHTTELWESFRSAASGMSSPFTLENRFRPATSIGMLSEMIIQIQDDVIERKKRKWRLELIKTVEQYISEVEDSILRYGATQHAGLTFKPSTMKADADLRFLALNLHQQLMTVGNAAPTSEMDVQFGDQASAARYARLVNTFIGTLMLSSPLHLSRQSSMQGPQSDLDSVQFIDDNASDIKDAPSSSPEEPPLEPVDALRRRVISFDSAETIVNKGASDQCVAVPSEQRKLAETIVAMGITEEEIQSIYELDENVGVSDAMDIVAAIMSGCSDDEMKHAVPSSGCFSSSQDSTSGKEMQKASMNIDTSASGHDPFDKHRMYGTTTVGAFAAHVYGFKSGGVRQMREELERLHTRLVKAAEASSDLTMDALERKYNELKWDVERRLEVAFCQAMSALVTCFQQTLYVHTHDNRDFGPYPLKACGVDYLEMLTRVGFLFSVESLLSTYGNELGMLGDTEAAVKELGRVCIKLRPVKSPRAAAFRVSITSGPSGIVIELPIITRRASEFPDGSMHRVPGQDAVSGAIYLSLSTPEQRIRAKFLFQKPIRVVPVIFSQGLNEMQTVANTVGIDSLQKEINAENVVELEAYVNNFANWVSKKQLRDKTSTPIYDIKELDLIQTSLAALKSNIQLSGRSKRMAILSLSSSIARSVGGGRVTMCKSAKDRTSMSITLEEANLLVRSHGLLADDVEAFTNLLRTYGVRRENARKNIGKAQYCFSALQNYMLPQDYQCPPGTGGGSRAYS